MKTFSSPGGEQNFSTRTCHMLGVDLVNFPRLETSPTRMKLLMQSVGKLRGRVGADNSSCNVQPLSHPSLPHRQATASRSLDEAMTFEEAIIAGRGTRQLPVIGPQQLLQGQSGRGRGRRELPRPRTSQGLYGESLPFEIRLTKVTLRGHYSLVRNNRAVQIIVQVGKWPQN